MLRLIQILLGVYILSGVLLLKIVQKDLNTYDQNSYSLMGIFLKEIYQLGQF